MLWRSAHRTPVARDVPLPTLTTKDKNPLSTFQVLIGGFNFYAYKEMSIWRRLLASEEHSARWAQVFFLEHPTAQDEELLLSIIPASEQPQSFIFLDQSLQWRTLVDPDRPDQAFAAVLRENQAVVMMKGAPTEDAWDAFLYDLTGGS